MIAAILRHARSYWRDPYAQPEPLPVPELIARAKQARAEVRDMTVAVDMNRSSR